MIIHHKYIGEKRITLTEAQAKTIWDVLMWGWDCGRDDMAADERTEAETINSQIKCWLKIEGGKK